MGEGQLRGLSRGKLFMVFSKIPFSLKLFRLFGLPFWIILGGVGKKNGVFFLCFGFPNRFPLYMYFSQFIKKIKKKKKLRGILKKKKMVTGVWLKKGETLFIRGGGLGPFKNVFFQIFLFLVKP